jgi:hypothetical protein
MDICEGSKLARWVESRDTLGEESQTCPKTYTEESIIDGWYEMIHYYSYCAMNITKTNSIA